MIRRLLILVTLFTIGTDLFSQQYFFKKYSIEEGLSQSSVFCIMQDSRGYIWIGTNGGGLSRFDGVRFETFTIADGLSDIVVRSLFEDSKGNIWIGTGKGLTLYDGFKFSAIGNDQGLKETAVLKITEGSDGMIWVATNNLGLFSLTTGDTINIRNYSQKDGLLNILIFDLYEDSEKNLWLAMGGGLEIVEFDDTASSDIKKIRNLEFDLPFESTIFLSIDKDSDGSFWIGTHSQGLYKAVQTTNNSGYKIEPSEINKLIPGLTVWDILAKKNGEVWIATDNYGVIRLRDDKIVGRFDKTNGLNSNQIMEISEDNEGNSWFASLGQGVFMYSNENLLVYKQDEGLTGNQVSDILFSSDDVFYASTEEGITCFSHEGNIIRKLNFFTSTSNLNDAGANTLIKKDNKIWIGTNYGIDIFDGNKNSEFALNNQLPDQKVNCFYNDSRDIMWIGTNGGYCRYTNSEIFPFTQDDGLIHNEVQTIIEDSEGRVWMGTVGGLVRLIMGDNINYTDFNTVDGLSTLWVNCLAEDPSGNIWIGTFGGGIFKFNQNTDSIPISVVATKGLLSSNTINSLLFIRDTMVIAGTDKGFDLLRLSKDQSITNVVHVGLSDGFPGETNTNSIAVDNEGFVWFGTKNGLVRFDTGFEVNSREKPGTTITGLKLFFETVNWKERGFNISKWTALPESLVLLHKDNHITFEYTGFSYQNPEDLLFSYSLEPQSKEWSPFSSLREITFQGLTPGSYLFKVRAKNKFGITGEAAEFRFIIKPPFWQTPWFIISALVIIIFGIVVFIRLRERNLINEKIKLEEIVEERTREVVEQKDEIARQRDVVTVQKKEITDSINYAETIQQAVLPEETILQKTFSDYFIILKPKDIVSGDFYWMTEKNNHVVFAAADCTGHGVPGALMSMLGVSYLNKIVNESGIVKPSDILSSLRTNVISSLKQKESYKASKDGMDIALCSLDMKKMKLSFSGANNPLYLIRKVENEYIITERKGDRMPVAYYSIMTDFTNHELDIQKGDTIYLFSDGYIDQFGGPDGRKFMIPRLKQLLLDNQELDMVSQREKYSNVLDEWINYPSPHSHNSEQVDDILLLGFRI